MSSTLEKFTLTAEKIIVSRLAAYLAAMADKKAAFVEKTEEMSDKIHEARAHSAETAAALKASAVSLLNYDKVASTG